MKNKGRASYYLPFAASQSMGDKDGTRQPLATLPKQDDM